MIDKLSSIWQGWRNNVNFSTFPQGLQDIFNKRLEICSDCEHFEEHWLSKRVTQLAGGDTTTRQKKFSHFRCSLCKCKASWKTSSEGERCPLNPNDYAAMPKWTEIIRNDAGEIINSGIPQ